MLNIIGKLEQYEIMQCDVVDRIVFNSWMGKVERNGAFMGSSTTDKILFSASIYHNKEIDLTKDICSLRIQSNKSYGLSFKVWRQSMQLKFFAELAILIATVIYFQFEVDELNNKLHRLRDIIKDARTKEEVEKVL